MKIKLITSRRTTTCTSERIENDILVVTLNDGITERLTLDHDKLPPKLTALIPLPYGNAHLGDWKPFVHLALAYGIKALNDRCRKYAF